ncbi:MAG: N-6 DNA methylase [Parvularcula sp.]|jgi:adenine-specific DNA-methyltransferase|nr:N-6 DNA methylase [Parvularcula sp.]
MLRLARAAANALRSEATSDASRSKLCRDLLRNTSLNGRPAEFAAALSKIPIDERHYWVGTFYTLLLDPAVRKEQATYFTPPNLAEVVLDLALEAGFDLEKDDVLDPAAGGAAFLSTIAGRAKEEGIKPTEASYRFNGIEIDRGLAALSRALIADRLGAKTRRGMIISGDALKTKI